MSFGVLLISRASDRDLGFGAVDSDSISVRSWLFSGLCVFVSFSRRRRFPEIDTVMRWSREEFLYQMR